MTTCETCGAVFVNRYQLGPHRRVCEQVAATAPVLITAPVVESEEEAGVQLPLFELSQRQPGFGQERPLFTAQHAPYVGLRTRNYKKIQQIWQGTVANTESCVDPRFWKVYKTVLSQTINCRDQILAVTKDILLAERVLVESRTGTSWPRSHRSLRE